MDLFFWFSLKSSKVDLFRVKYLLEIKYVGKIGRIINSIKHEDVFFVTNLGWTSHFFMLYFLT